MCVCVCVCVRARARVCACVRACARKGKESRHLSNLKVIFLRPEQKKMRVIILNERGLEPRMLP